MSMFKKKHKYPDYYVAINSFKNHSSHITCWNIFSFINVKFKILHIISHIPSLWIWKYTIFHRPLLWVVARVAKLCKAIWIFLQVVKACAIDVACVNLKQQKIILFFPLLNHLYAQVFFLFSIFKPQTFKVLIT